LAVVVSQVPPPPGFQVRAARALPVRNAAVAAKPSAKAREHRFNWLIAWLARFGGFMMSAGFALGCVFGVLLRQSAGWHKPHVTFEERTATFCLHFVRSPNAHLSTLSKEVKKK
jgi:hypothetical protein